MKRLIINGDDFGLSEGINRGIIKAYREGILTSTTLMPNGPAFEDAILQAKSNFGLGVGIHLNIVRGKSILSYDKVSSLVDKKGYFFLSPKQLAAGIIFRKVELSEIQNEFRAQIEKVISAGICPTHFDTEKHIHVLPSVSNIIVNLAQEFEIKRIRCFRCNIAINNLFSFKFFVSLFFRILFVLKTKRLADRKVLMPDRIYGVFDGGKMLLNEYRDIFKYLPHGISEIVCHPGYNDEQLKLASRTMGKYYLNKFRELELEALLDPNLKAFARKLGIDLISYRYMV